jgi:hypothetical protein
MIIADLTPIGECMSSQDSFGTALESSKELLQHLGTVHAVMRWHRGRGT